MMCLALETYPSFPFPTPPELTASAFERSENCDHPALERIMSLRPGQTRAAYSFLL